MKKSELKLSIKEEIMGMLSEITPEDVKNQEEYNTELEKTVQLQKDAGLTEGYDAYDEIAQSEFEMDYDQLGPNEQEWVRDEYDNQPSGRDVHENDDIDDDVEPTAKQLKGDSVATIATKLQQTTKEMKSTVNKWKTAEGEEKNKLRNKLLKLTNIKKELESML